MTILNKTWARGLIPLLAGFIFASGALAGEREPYRYDEESVATAAYFAAIANLANAVMFSGLGEDLITSPYERDDWLRRAGYVVRPAMAEIAAVGPVYAAATPRFLRPPNFAEPETLAWDPSSFDRTLEPSAQAWAMIKITSPEFHLQFHRLPENRLAGLMMVPQARLQAETLEKRLLNAVGHFVARTPDGRFGDPAPRDQAAVLWAVSNLILAGTSARDDYWHAAYRDLTDAEDYRGLANTALTAVETLAPEGAGDRALAIEALGRFALATNDDDRRRQALDLARGHAAALTSDPGTGLEDLALAVYGLTEAARLLRSEKFSSAASRVFRDRLVPLWDDAIGVFRADQESVVYTPRIVGAVVVALDAIRWYGNEHESAQARRLYPRFFEVAVVRSGLLRASPLPLVAAAYREDEPDAHFAHPALPDTGAAGVPPVFAAEVTFQAGAWTVTDATFRTADALFLANMLAMRSDGRADTFLPDDRLEHVLP